MRLQKTKADKRKINSYIELKETIKWLSMFHFCFSGYYYDHMVHGILCNKTKLGQQVLGQCSLFRPTWTGNSCHNRALIFYFINFFFILVFSTQDMNSNLLCLHRLV